MVRKKVINHILRIFLYWFVAMLVSTIIISIFSCFVPFEKLETYDYYGFNAKSLVYFKLTIFFYLSVSFLIAAPGFIINLIIYIFRKKNIGFISNKILSILLNVIIGLAVLYLYQSLGITRKTDFLYIILPAYIISITGFGFIMLPKRPKGKE